MPHPRYTSVNRVSTGPGMNRQLPQEIIDYVHELAELDGSDSDIITAISEKFQSRKISVGSVKKYAKDARIARHGESEVNYKTVTAAKRVRVRELFDLGYSVPKIHVRMHKEHFKVSKGFIRNYLKELDLIPQVHERWLKRIGKGQLEKVVKNEPEPVSNVAPVVLPLPLELEQLVTVFQNALDNINFVQVTIDNLRPSIVQGLLAAQNLVNTDVMMSELQLLRVGIDIASVAVETQTVIQQDKVSKIAGNLFTQLDEEVAQRNRELLEKAYSDANLSEKSLNQGA